MIQTEEMPLELQNARFISLHLRKLAANYPQLSKDSWLRRAVPAFLFGQLTVRLTPIWDSAVEALQQISQDKSVLETTASLENERVVGTIVAFAYHICAAELELGG